MDRLSREARLLRITLPLFIVLFAAMFVLSIYVFTLDRRIARELAPRSWRVPTVISSEYTGRTREIARVYGTDWRPTPPVLLEQLPPHVADAFLAAEDVRFRRHIGVDPIGILRALFVNVRARGIAQGGSTIPQQIVKQRFLTNERTWRRKIVEGVLAIALDRRLSKDDLLELYLNDVYLGHHAGNPILGIDEASRLYFDKTPRALRLDEAALLAAMIRAPNRDTPEKRPDLARMRRDAILNVMRNRRWIDDNELRTASAHPVDVSRGALPERPYPFYLRALRAEVVEEVGARTVTAGGLTIVCEMNADAQRAAEREARLGAQRLRARYRWIRQQSARDPLQVAILSIDPRSGGVRALVGGTDYDRSPFDRTSQMRRQPGSAFKTFAYLAAIASKKATTSSLLLDSPVKIELSSNEVWEPQNYDERFRGRVTLRESFERSLNVPTVRMTRDIGIRRVANVAKDFGFTRVETVPAMSLGVGEVSMRELTTAYTAFPNLGERVEPFLLRRVVDRKGKQLFERKPKPKKRVVDASAAYVMHTLLRGVVRRGTATRLKRYDLGYVAGKTGTTNDYRDAWFVGYTQDVVTTVWVGFDRGAPLRLSSSEAALPVWGAYMSATPHTASNPKPPPGVTFRDIDPESGMLWRRGCPGPIREVYLDGTAPTRHCPAGIFGRIVRRVLFDEEHFDEPAAITFEKFRKWANDADRNRQNVESVLEKLKRIFD
ncbi:MAG TPA: PBP1A family penicillin-binding protein [Thermoanaerobaculia bacterium]|nr:PBP1A family penicillin-binding protein [Thermoanaerobaculia bacterium]